MCFVWWEPDDRIDMQITNKDLLTKEHLIPVENISPLIKITDCRICFCQIYYGFLKARCDFAVFREDSDCKA